MKEFNLKGLLLFLVNWDSSHDLGVVKKCQYQIDAYMSLGVKVNYCYAKESFLMCNDQVLTSFYKNSVVRKYYTQVKFFQILINSLDFKDYNFIHIRYPLSSKALLRFFEAVKVRNPKIKIIVDVSTYPYNSETGNFFNRIRLKQDTYYSQYLDKYVDRVITYCGQEEIFNVPTIKLTNGIRIEQQRESNLKEVYELPSILKAVGVANVAFWHGFDRFIRGLAIYEKIRSDDKTKNISLPIVEFYIIGNGAAIDSLKELSINLGIETLVKFINPIFGEELDSFLSRMDFGVSTLGAYRKKLYIHSSLKSREYCMRGIPFIFADTDPDFDNNTGFVMSLPSDDSNVDILEIVKFYENLVLNNPKFKFEMYNYAVDNLSWVSKIDKIVKYLEYECQTIK